MATGSSLILALRQRVYALVGALLLATACLQAIGPIEAPLERSQGSAFSAATIDVAVVRPRAGEVLRQAVAPVPLPVLVPAVPDFSACPAAPSAIPVRPDSTGPPPCDRRIIHPGPRAPPFS